MSPVHEQAIEKLNLLSDAQIQFIIDIIDGLRALGDSQPAKDPFYHPANIRFVENSIKALKDGKGTVHDLIEVE